MSADVAVTADGSAVAAAMPGLPMFYQSVHERNVNLVRKLMEVVLPVTYSDDFFKKLATEPNDFTKMAYYNDIFVGVIASRIEPAEGANKKLYITVCAVLAPYRNRGIGSALMQQVFEALPKHPEIKEVYLHVWVKNEGALQFYSRHGFEQSGRLQNYYQRIEEPHAWVLSKAVNGSTSGGASK